MGTGLQDIWRTLPWAVPFPGSMWPKDTDRDISRLEGPILHAQAARFPRFPLRPEEDSFLLCLASGLSTKTSPLLVLSLKLRYHPPGDH